MKIQKRNQYSLGIKSSLLIMLAELPVARITNSPLFSAMVLASEVSFRNATAPYIFIFEYSLNGGAYQPLPLLNVSSTSYTTLSDSLPPGSSGSVVIRVVDSNQVSGNRTLDTVYVDDLYIQVGSPSSDPPIGNPSNLSASSLT